MGIMYYERAIKCIHTHKQFIFLMEQMTPYSYVIEIQEQCLQGVVHINSEQSETKPVDW